MRVLLLISSRKGLNPLTQDQKSGSSKTMSSNWLCEGVTLINMAFMIFRESWLAVLHYRVAAHNKITNIMLFEKIQQFSEAGTR